MNRLQQTASSVDTPCGRGSRRFFTLIEMIAALAVFLVLMLVVFQFFGAAQKVWSATNASVESFENARVIEDIVSRDLKSAVATANDIPGSNLMYRQTNCNTLMFVTSGATSSNGKCELMIVAYTLDGTDFKRATLDSSDSPNWESKIYHVDTAVLPTSSLQTVANNVLDFSITPFDKTMTPIPASTMNQLPYAVVLQFKLLDKKGAALASQLTGTSKAAAENRTSRTFTKFILLNTDP